MITNKYGIHTFSLKLQCKYSEIQNIIEQNECIRTSNGKLGLSPYYQMPQFKLSRCDLTYNLYYERKADVQDRLNIFKKSFPIPITTRLSSVNIQIPMKNSREPISIRGQSRISLKAVLSQFMINRMSLRNGMISRLVSIFSVWNCGLGVRKSLN